MERKKNVLWIRSFLWLVIRIRRLARKIGFRAFSAYEVRRNYVPFFLQLIAYDQMRIVFSGQEKQ
jgi:hypothetical protein